ncbi:MAG: hypothetical protein ACJAZ2_001173 [Glaciecola sp.]|jgi:hypothetical protein
MKIIKYILPRLIACVVIIILSNIIYKNTFWKNDVSKHGDILENLWVMDKNAEAIYLGESSNFYMTEKDTVKYRISSMLNDMLPDINLAHVDNSGLHAGTYLTVINNFDKNNDIKLLVITLNIRSFGANWRYALGENYLAKTEVMLAEYPIILNKFLVSLKNYDYKTDEDRLKEMKLAWQTETFDVPDFKYHNVNAWDSAMAWHEWVNTNPNLSEELVPLACHYVKNFAFKIDTSSNARIHDFDEIMKVAKKRNYKVVFNLLSENMHEAKMLAGDELIYLIEYNRSLLIDRYETKGAIVVDNLYTVPDSCFADRNWPTEHYSKQGKEMIAKKIKEVIQERYLNDNKK